MSEPIKPALTPEEWAAGWARRGEQTITRHPDGVEVYFNGGVHGALIERSRDAHAVAALALQGQPFGFTWEDVDALDVLVNRPEERQLVDRWRAQAAIARMAALLPPRDPRP